MSKWTNVEVSFTVELGYDEGWKDLTYEKPLPAALLVELAKLPPDCDGLELDFDIRSSGYYSPAVMYLRNGDPGYPEEGDDERECKGVYLLLDGKKRIPLYKTLADELEGLYQEEINSADLPESDYEGDRGDYEYDRMKDGD